MSVNLHSLSVRNFVNPSSQEVEEQQEGHFAKVEILTDQDIPTSEGLSSLAEKTKKASYTIYPGYRKITVSLNSKTSFECERLKVSLAATLHVYTEASGPSSILEYASIHRITVVCRFCAQTEEVTKAILLKATNLELDCSSVVLDYLYNKKRMTVERSSV